MASSAARADDGPKLTPTPASEQRFEFYARLIWLFALCNNFPDHLRLQRDLLRDPGFETADLPDDWRLMVRVICRASQMRMMAGHIFPDQLVKRADRQRKRRKQ